MSERETMLLITDVIDDIFDIRAKAALVAVGIGVMDDGRDRPPAIDGLIVVANEIEAALRDVSDRMEQTKRALG